MKSLYLASYLDLCLIQILFTFTQRLTVVPKRKRLIKTSSVHFLKLKFVFTNPQNHISKSCYYVPQLYPQHCLLDIYSHVENNDRIVENGPFSSFVICMLRSRKLNTLGLISTPVDRTVSYINICQFCKKNKRIDKNFAKPLGLILTQANKSCGYDI